MLRALLRSGLLRPGRPWRLARQLLALWKWGLGPAGQVYTAAARSPDMVAIVDEDGQVTYGELLRRVKELSQTLQEFPARRVGVLSRNHRGAVEGMAAALVAGADAVLLNTQLKSPQLVQVVQEQGLDLLYHEAEFASSASAIPGVEVPWKRLARIHVPELWAPRMSPAEQPTPRRRVSPRTSRRSARVIMLTAGTTGVPKGAALSRPPGLAPLLSILSRIPLRVGDRIFIAVPLFGMWGHGALQAALSLRATVVLRRRFNPVETLRMVEKEGCTVLIAAPVMLERILELPHQPPASLRLVVVGGSALSGQLATRFMDAYGDVLYNVYGSTEASCVSLAVPSDLRRCPDTVGRPPQGIEVAILGPDGEPVPTGSVGRIFVRSAMLFGGYISSTSRIAGPEQRRGMTATGDLGHLSDDGLLFVDGREDDMIISGGENVFPGPVEALIAALPQVREVAVIGVPDATYGQSLAAFVVVREGMSLDAEQVRAHVRANLTRPSVPRDVTFLPELPRNPAGKVIPRNLPGMS
ncbi:AMP-binding protein [Streptomyces sp. NRRL S-118]|uniref:AMP-binding protein n=1 Tax=Streptomyces sp. NRRL S-118 TaxID=1463881 RepID=UPI0004C95039|nr:AMP-binding protein [Streptomyces sp. NRRL S-118]